ncbi:MAG: 4Fe-4S binding protein, partial [Spirochaetaceae bacterium]|nr:4Fe-4S binding protein [Spirochaetaceae bacterium]
MNISRKIVLHFPPHATGKSVVCGLARDYGLEFNILKASITPGEEGLLIMELSGEQNDYDRGVKHLLEAGIQIQSLSQDVVRDENRCTHCGACVTICPSEAFSVDPDSKKILFAQDKCIVCG